MFRPLLPPPPYVIPTVYADTLSYHETLDKVLYHMGKMNDFMNEQFSNVYQTISNVREELQNDYNKKIAGFEQKVEDLRTDVYNELDKMQKAIDDFTANITKYVEDSFDRIQKYVSDYIKAWGIYLLDEIQKIKSEYDEMLLAFLNSAKEYTDTSIVRYSIEVDKSIQRINDRITNLQKEFPQVFDPITGDMQNIQRVIYDLYNALRVLGLTAFGYDKIELTVDEYDNIGLTAIQYDVYGSYFLNNEWFGMFNPISGVFESVQTVVNDLYTTFRFNGKTANEYDGLEITAEEFDNSDFTAVQHDLDKWYKSTTPDYHNKRFNLRKLLWTDPDIEEQSGGTIIALGTNELWDSYTLEYKQALDGRTKTGTVLVNPVNESIISITENVIDNTASAESMKTYTRKVEVNVTDTGEYTLVLTDCEVYETLISTVDIANDNIVITSVYGNVDMEQVFNG